MHHLWYSQPVSEEHPITPNRPLRNGCIWRHYGARETHQTLKTDLGPRCVIFDHIIQSRCLSYWGGSQPASEEQRLYGAIGHIKHWKPCQGDPMCYFGTNYRLLIYPWCVILPTGQWGTPPLLPTSHWGTAALWGDKAHWTLETLSGWPDVLFRDKYAFLDTCIICDTPNRPLRNTSLLPTGHWGMDAFDTTMGQVKHIKHSKPSRGAQMCNFWTYNSNPMSAYRGDSQPASEERPLLPTGHWGTTAVWGDRALSTLRTLSGGPDVLFRDK